MVTVDEHGYITRWNPGATRIFGYSEQEMLGKILVHVFPMLRKDVARASRFGDQTRDHLWRVRTRTGQTVEVASISYPMTLANGNRTTMVYIRRTA
ncbi:MAG: PAS domain S-box protein [Desulfatibacillaceae bacterium]